MEKKQIYQAAVQLLDRVQLTGAETPIFIEVRNELLKQAQGTTNDEK